MYNQLTEREDGWIYNNVWIVNILKISKINPTLKETLFYARGFEIEINNKNFCLLFIYFCVAFRCISK